MTVNSFDHMRWMLPNHMGRWCWWLELPISAQNR